MENKHRWTYDDEDCCCSLFVHEYVVKRATTTPQEFVRKLQQKLPQISTLSLRMKCQNIKQILIEEEVADTSTFSPLKNYSRQNAKVLKYVLWKTGVKYVPPTI